MKFLIQVGLAAVGLIVGINIAQRLKANGNQTELDVKALQNRAKQLAAENPICGQGFTTVTVPSGSYTASNTCVVHSAAKAFIEGSITAQMFSEILQAWV